MRYKEAFIMTERGPKGTKSDEVSGSAELIRRAGLIQQVASGYYNFLPIGKKILRKIEAVIREEMEAASALEVSMPFMQPAELWKQSGRWDIYGEEMFKLKSRSGREFCLGPTHEELIVNLVASQIKSYRDLPVTLYQLSTKFRDEIRARGGLIRAREFIMKDAYSFDITLEGLEESYKSMRVAYLRIMKRLQIEVTLVPANSGEMGGGYSEEFLAESPDGEDRFYLDAEGIARKADSEDCDTKYDIKTAVEIGHIFKLGTRYSEVMGLTCITPAGADVSVMMGCYGIGVSRLIPTIVSQNRDVRGITWPHEIAPYSLSILAVSPQSTDLSRVVNEIHDVAVRAGLDVILDDRPVSMGVKFHDNDAIGIPRSIVVGPRDISSGTVELAIRSTGEKRTISIGALLENPCVLLR